MPRVRAASHQGENPELSIVLPVYDEEESLGAVDQELRGTLRALGRKAEVIYVDDGSTDRTPEVLGEILAESGGDAIPTRVVRLRQNFGQTAALAAGFELVRGEVTVCLDADGQNDPADIPRLLARLEEGYDVVSGWRRQRRDKALSRRLPSWVANRLVAAFSGVKLHDSGCTLKAYRSRFLKEQYLWGEMHRFIPSYLARIGARITEIEVNHRPRLRGASHYGSERIVRVLLDLVMIHFMSKYFTRPMHFFGQVALGFIALAFGALAFMVTFKYGWLRHVGIDYQASFVETPLPALAATFLIGAISSLFFGILGEVLVRIYYEIGRLTPYRIEKVRSSDA